MTLKNKSIFVILAIVLISIASTYYIAKLKFNYDFESYFPQKDCDLEYLLQFRKDFENDTDFLIVAIENKKGIYDTVFLNKINSLSIQIKGHAGVRKIIAPTNLKTPVMGAGGFFEIPLLHTHDSEKLIQDSIRIAKYPYLSSGLISKTKNAVAIVIFNTQNIKKKAGDDLIDFIDSEVAAQHFDNVYTAGKIKASKIYVEKMQEEVLVFIIASTILIGLFLFIAYRTVWGVVVPLITVVLSIAWTLAIMSILGKDLDLLTSLLPPILFVVAMSDMTHLLSKYLEELRHGTAKIPALTLALKDVGLATFITAVTTAIGFVTLLNSTIAPIRDFGFYTGIGVFVAFALAFTFLPAALVLLPAPPIAKLKNENVFWYRMLQKLFIWICGNPYLILSTTISLVMVAIFFTFKISVDAKLLDDISDKDPLKKSVQFLEDNFGGVRPFEMAIYAKDLNSLMNYAALSKLNEVEIYLKNKYQVRDIISPNTFIKYLMQASNGGLDEYYKFPSKEEFETLLPKLKLITKRKEFAAFCSKDFSKMRVSGKIKDDGSLAIANKNKDLAIYLTTIGSNQLWNYQLTGSSLLIDKNNSYLAQSLIEDLILGIISIALIIGLLFRQTKMIVLALIPNLIPLLVIGGIMGTCGIHLKASTSIIFSIAFGIAVDDSIHFLSRFKMELRLHQSHLYALKRTYLSTGKAMIVTSLILISGFATLLLSSFESTFYTGFLIGLTLLIAIVADLLLLPVLLMLFYKKGNKTK